ncbi:hypothetical protein CJJ07_000679 [Candidozyma auris]|nr:hypothetical protein CJJ07_000679 [[Candida] auris]QEL62641.1 hypothetical protein CJJ09_004820 [[Candida] auris]
MNYKEAVKELRREPLLLRNRLYSILVDAQYVEQFAALQLPLVANERCGLWYVKPHLLRETAYYKSTDGHTGQWKLSLRRLNFHLLPLFKEFGGIVLVDSTRKGKLIPDALSKTVPIWCAVLNYVMFEGQETKWNAQKDCWLRTPREMVSESEHCAIVERIPQFAEELKRLGLISKKKLIEKLGGLKPLVPVWRYPGQKVQNQSSNDYFVVMCVTASAVSLSESTPHFHYVQGAADDHELWATSEVCNGNLDAKLIWEMLSCENEELRVIDPQTGNLFNWLSDGELVKRLNGIYEGRAKAQQSPLELTALGETGIFIGAIDGDLGAKEVDQFDAVVVLSDKHRTDSDENKKCRVLNYIVEDGKLGSKKLRTLLPQIMGAVADCRTVLVLCNSGKDLSVGVVLCILCQRFDTSWKSSSSHLVNKDVIKQHLGKIADYTKINPSRNTLQSVNTFLMAR